MSLTINIYYTGNNGSAIKFINEMISSGLLERIRGEQGNLKYEYYIPVNDSQTVLLIDKWINQAALNAHHKSEMMKEIAALRCKYGLKMRVERYESIST